MAAEVLYIPVTTDDMPRFLSRTNQHGSPTPALVMSAGLVQLLLAASSTRCSRAGWPSC
jgi:arginine:ornithine antiporter / lysine permease